MTPRRAIPADLPFLLGLAKAAYDSEVDLKAVARWLEHSIFDPDIMMLRTEDAGGVATVLPLFHHPHRLHGHMLFLARNPNACMASAMDAFRVLRALVEWARSRGAIDFSGGSDTNVDLGPFFKRLGGVSDTPSYVISFEGERWATRSAAS